MNACPMKENTASRLLAHRCKSLRRTASSTRFVNLPHCSVLSGHGEAANLPLCIAFSKPHDDSSKSLQRTPSSTRSVSLRHCNLLSGPGEVADLLLCIAFSKSHDDSAEVRLTRVTRLVDQTRHAECRRSDFNLGPVSVRLCTEAFVALFCASRSHVSSICSWHSPSFLIAQAPSHPCLT